MSHSFSLGSVYVELPPAERFAQFLQSRGKRLTPQRQIIVEQVFSHHDHFDADELIEHLRDWISTRKLSRPTVYRTLSELVEAGMLRSMTLSGRSVYEHEYGYPRHDHLYCQHCNRLIEFHSAALDRLCAALAREYQFQVTAHRMFVMGICDQCRARDQAAGGRGQGAVNKAPGGKSGGEFDIKRGDAEGTRKQKTSHG